jgi:uncharacterized Zn finger protein (UPF0148 family)
MSVDVCPFCGYDPMEEVPRTDGTYECPSCGEKTHEKIEAMRDDLEDLAASDNPASRVAALLAGKGQ